jgi:predicted transcriptional regulator
VSVPCLFILNLLFVNPKSLGSEIPKTKNKKTDMKKLIMKLLGLNTLVAEVVRLKKENEELKKSLAELTEKVDEIEIPDFDADDFVREDDVNDRIESYLNDNDYASQSYVDDEIESKVSDAVESAVEDIDLTDKVKEVVDEMDKPSFCDTEELKDIVRTVLRDIKIKFE